MQNPEELDKKRRAYQSTFNNPMGEQVLFDLAKFCRINNKAYIMGMSQLDLAYAAGLRDAYLRIQNHLNISDDDIWQLTNKTEMGEIDHE